MKMFRIIFLALLASVVTAIVVHVPFYKSCEEIRSNALRLHIVANSDGELDQSAKLAVRDAVLEATRDIFACAKDSDSARQAAAEALPVIESVAEKALYRLGIKYEASAGVCRMYFDQLSYGGATLPAGVYDALRIELGAATGKNWWCVMYPPLCVLSSSAGETEAVNEAFAPEEAGIVLGGETYAVKFYAEELFQRFKLWATGLVDRQED